MTQQGDVRSRRGRRDGLLVLTLCSHTFPEKFAGSAGAYTRECLPDDLIFELGGRPEQDDDRAERHRRPRFSLNHRSLRSGEHQHSGPCEKDLGRQRAPTKMVTAGARSNIGDAGQAAAGRVAGLGASRTSGPTAPNCP